MENFRFPPNQNPSPRAVSFVYLFLLFSAGDHDKREKEDHEADHAIERIDLHFQWDQTTLNNDIALLVLKDSIQFDRNSYHVYPICLPDSEPKVGDNCYITGKSMLLSD